MSVYRNVVFERLSKQRLLTLNSNESGQYISLLTSQMDNLGQNYFYTFFLGIIFTTTIFGCQFALLDNKPSDGSICYYFKYSKYSDTNNFQEKITIKKSSTIAATNDYVNKTNDLFSGLTDWKVNRSESAVVAEENKINKKLLHSEKEELKTENTVTVLNKTFSDFLYFGT